MLNQNTDGSIVISAAIDASGVAEGIAKMKAVLAELRAYAQSQFGAIRDSAIASGGDMAEKMPGIAGRMIAALSGGLADGRERVAASVRGVTGQAISAGLEDAARFSGVGRYMIAGIISGVWDSASSLWDTMRSLAGQMLSTLKQSLGIQSPSRLMREEVGRQIGAGLAAGILDSRPDVTEAAQSLTDAAAGGAASGVTGWRSAVAPAQSLLRGHISTAVSGGAVSAGASAAAAVPASSGTVQAASNTFIFQRPVETPYEHARAVRETMEAMLYGI